MRRRGGLKNEGGLKTKGGYDFVRVYRGLQFEGS